MKELILADLRRVRRKASFKVIMIILLFIQFTDMLSDYDTAFEYVDKARNRYFKLCLLMISIFIFMALFADDQKSNSYVAVIGNGITRSKLILAKAIVAVIIMGIYYIVIASFRNFLYLLLSTPITANQRHTIMLYALFAVLKGIICIILSVAVLYVTNSTILGLITNIILTSILGVILQFLQMTYNIGVYDYMYDGLLDGSISNISVGRFPWQLIVLIVVYLIGGYLLASYLFKKKELQL